MRGGGTMKTLHSVIDRISTLLGRVAEVVVVLLIASMLYEVVARYVFGAPTLWAFDIAYMSTGALFVLGAAQALRQDAHVRIDVLSSRFPPRVRGGHRRHRLPVRAVPDLRDAGQDRRAEGLARLYDGRG